MLLMLHSHRSDPFRIIVEERSKMEIKYEMA